MGRFELGLEGLAAVSFEEMMGEVLTGATSEFLLSQWRSGKLGSENWLWLPPFCFLL